MRGIMEEEANTFNLIRLYSGEARLRSKINKSTFAAPKASMLYRSSLPAVG